MTLDSEGLGTSPPPEKDDEPSLDPDGTVEGHQDPDPGALIGLGIVVAAVIAASAIIALLVF